MMDIIELICNDIFRFIISIIIIPTIVSFIIATFFYYKKNEQLKVWGKGRDFYLKTLYGKIGTSFRLFNRTFKHLLEKDQIYEQDLVIFNKHELEDLRNKIAYDQKGFQDLEIKTQIYIPVGDFCDLSSIFTNMLSFIKIFNENINSDPIKSINLERDKILQYIKKYTNNYNFYKTRRIRNSIKLQYGYISKSPI